MKCQYCKFATIRGLNYLRLPMPFDLQDKYPQLNPYWEVHFCSYKCAEKWNSGSSIKNADSIDYWDKQIKTAEKTEAE